VAAQIRDLIASTGADEIMVTTMIHDHAARLRSYELLAHAGAGEPAPAAVV
jgi:alkanesulfonate monooxygenase SsuD/methylene tetrahydromethanopterin reductase-like flavin-dependent oxidoreductase (luciferase family)